MRPPEAVATLRVLFFQRRGRRIGNAQVALDLARHRGQQGVGGGRLPGAQRRDSASVHAQAAYGAARDHIGRAWRARKQRHLSDQRARHQAAEVERRSSTRPAAGHGDIECPVQQQIHRVRWAACAEQC